MVSQKHKIMEYKVIANASWSRVDYIPVDQGAFSDVRNTNDTNSDR